MNKKNVRRSRFFAAGLIVVGLILLASLVTIVSRFMTKTACRGIDTAILSPPARMRYPVGYSGEIDLSGLTVELEKPFFLQREYVLTDSPYELTTDADFAAPGSYIVEVRFVDKQGVNRKFWFTVAVEEP